MSGAISATKIEPSGATPSPCPSVPKVRQRQMSSPSGEKSDNLGVWSVTRIPPSGVVRPPSACTARRSLPASDRRDRGSARDCFTVADEQAAGPIHRDSMRRAELDRPASGPSPGREPGSIRSKAELPVRGVTILESRIDTHSFTALDTRWSR